jgi:hypothetical protein
VHRPHIVQHHRQRQLLGLSKLLNGESLHLYGPYFSGHFLKALFKGWRVLKKTTLVF